MAKEWLLQLLWSLLYTAWEMVQEKKAPKHDALGLCLRSLEKIIAVDWSPTK
ncbi:hypothetical protein P3102_23465 [Amycolatopsis sp. QT-25]|uniref:hypothetical protein n=1 Tax=Amycolatopsis sp. QT-25 TaxID=3034022 RepID=UPI0023EB7252|nr:hypothetical protein [Amycolatopsis sp. QT-25]WET77056.1 hypothetical protein P3102_23465 [Amycolatopsis sp. QT-25]